MKKYKGFLVPDVGPDDDDPKRKMKWHCFYADCSYNCEDGEKCIFDRHNPEAVKAFIEWEKEENK